MNRSSITFAFLFLLLGSVLAHATIVGPYTPDGFTLHLWHFNEGATPVVDSAANGTNLTATANGATLGNTSFAGFGSALSCYDGGPNGVGATGKDAVLSALPLVNGPGDNVLMSFADPTTGAFTFEALVRIDFNPLANFGSIATGGNGRTNQMIILSGEDEVNAGRIFQLRIDPIGTFSNSVIQLEFINVNQATTIQSVILPIPTNGLDAIVSNGWYHVAVTYDGNAGAANNLNFYWTLLDANRTNASLLGSASLTADLPVASTDFTIGNTGRGAAGANFVGLIDEVRMSSTARAATDMMFGGGVQPPPTPTTSAALYLQCLTNFETYAESIWHTASYSGAPADAGYWGDGGSAGNGGIRGNSGIALAYATLVVAQPGSPQNTLRLARIRQALNYNNATHIVSTNKCVNGSQWGWSSASSTDWQTPEWSGSMGLACVLVQTNLPVATVSNVQRVVASEATHRAAIAPASGFNGDTKAEENAWQGNILALAAAWMSTNASGSNWLYAAKRYCANSYTVADTSGDPLASWVSTVTLYPSFALENHGFYHPTYEMVAGMSCGDSLLMAKLSNPIIAAQLQPFAEHNVMSVWTNNLNALVMDSGDFAYPAGLDWELHDFEQNSFITWIAAHFNDPLARWTDDKLAQCVRYRQIVNGDGSLVGPSSGGFYREAVEARRTAIAWLHWATADYPTGPSLAPGGNLMHDTDVEVIHQRSAYGNFSVSYNDTRIMAIIEPAAQATPTNAFIASPKLPGVIGLGLGNPTSAELISFATNANGFDAEVQIVNGAQGTTEVYIKSTGETFAMVEVPQPAPAANLTSSGSFTCGIENDPLTGGARLLEWLGGSANITNRTGALRNVTNNWICVSGRYGLAAGPDGYFKYQAASSYNRLGAAEDSLQFMSTNTFAPRYAVWFPAKTAAQTATGAGQINWVISGTNATLTFPGAGGAPVQLNAVVPLPASPTSYPPYVLPVAAVTASSTQSPYVPENVIDGNLANFWVSQFGPTNHAEWLKVEFPRAVVLSQFRVTPRIENGGYGPSTIQLVVNVTNAIPASGIPTSGSNIYSGSVPPTATLNAALTQPVYATNAVLVITGSYDHGTLSNPRNTQVSELTFLERAMPGTFGDWAVRTFNDEQIADVSISGPFADADGDGAANLLEFVTGGNPLVVDADNFKMKPAMEGGQFRIRFVERKNLGDVTREFVSSTDLSSWSTATPLSVTPIQDLGETQLLEATFATPTLQSFIRLNYHQ